MFEDVETEDGWSNPEHTFRNSHLLSSEASTGGNSDILGSEWTVPVETPRVGPGHRVRSRQWVRVTVTLAIAVPLKSESSGEPLGLFGLKCGDFPLRTPSVPRQPPWRVSRIAPFLPQRNMRAALVPSGLQQPLVRAKTPPGPGTEPSAELAMDADLRAREAVCTGERGRHVTSAMEGTAQ